VALDFAPLEVVRAIDARECVAKDGIGHVAAVAVFGGEDRELLGPQHEVGVRERGHDVNAVSRRGILLQDVAHGCHRARVLVQGCHG
jgi:hypothetical protein